VKVKAKKLDDADAAHVSAILAAPDDDGPRLVWADKLAERGDARGELIAVQCELARLGPGDAVRAHELALQEEKLLDEHAGDWRKPYAKLLRPGDFRRGWHDEIPDEFRHRRGLPEIAFTDGATFAARAAEILEKNPFCRGLEIHDHYGDRTDEPWLALAKTAGLARLDTLRLREVCMTDKGMTTLADSPHLAGLRELAFVDVLHGAKFANRIARSPHLGKLRRLSLNDSVGGEAIKALGKSTTLASLEELDVGGGVTREDAGRFFAEARFPKLRSLLVNRGRLLTKGVKGLATAPWLAQLHTLDVGDNGIGAEGLKAVVESKRLGKLVRLGAERCTYKAGPAARKLGPIVAGCASLASVAWLSLAGNSIGDAGAAAIASSRSLRELAWLDLADNDLGEAGVRALLETKLPRLSGVNLTGNTIPAALVKPLRERFRLVLVDDE
jgi:uncharacterized protein (TIGR02996 family)